jgi:phenylalanyl-tRNA synthetase beta chain
VELDMSPAELEQRLSMAGLNHEGTHAVDDDLAIELEVTSNRPDCLGHLGIAREVAVLWQRRLEVPQPEPVETRPSAEQLASVQLECPDLCPRYTARVIRGVHVGPSPAWLANRLRTSGVGVINNVVDVTNYVMLECGQPLHAFDLARLDGRQISVRSARENEPFLAIDHRAYTLQPGMCVIADASRAVALGGVMGGVDAEVSETTTELLIEAAEFAPLPVRSTARQLRLHSPSSYRFERGVDPAAVDWASRRACQLILELAGGKLAAGCLDAGGRQLPQRPAIVLRLAQLKRVLGIDLPRQRVRDILTALGNRETGAHPDTITLVPPSWRHDLSREIDLIEEVARIHGYDQIPEDVGVAMVPSHRGDQDRVIDKVRQVLTAAGFHEAITPSVVTEEWSACCSPWTSVEPYRTSWPMLRGADRLRRSLIPSLLGTRQVNESLAHPDPSLFEIARVYLPRAGGLPQEETLVALCSGGDFHALKGVVESMVERLHTGMAVQIENGQVDLLDPAASCQLRLNGQTLGYLGLVHAAARKLFGLRQPAAVAELKLAALCQVALLIPQYQPLSPYPAVTYDVNLVVEEPVRWAELAQTVRRSGGPHLEDLIYRETYRDPQKDGPGKKRLFFSLTFRARDRTLTGSEAETARDGIVAACEQEHAATLLA